MTDGPEFGSTRNPWALDRVSGGSEIVVEAPLERIPVWVRAGSIVVTYPPEHVATGLGDTPESERPLIATLWGEPRLGHAAARLADLVGELIDVPALAPSGVAA